MEQRQNPLDIMVVILYIFIDNKPVQDPFEWDEVGRNLFSMFMLGIGFFILNLVIEYNFCCCRGLVLQYLLVFMP